MLGSDISGIRDLDWALSTVSGRTALAHAILRRLTTSRGRLVTDTSYGYNMRDIIGTSASVTEITQGVSDQVFAEEEVEDATIDVYLIGTSVRVVITVTDGEGPFTLTLLASEVTIEALIDGSLFWSST